MSENIDADEARQQSYDEWRMTWNLDDMTPREIYEIAFRHGYEFAKEDAAK